MEGNTPKDTLIFELMNGVRKLTRSSLMMQNAIAEKVGLNVTDAECIDFLQEMGPSTAGDLAKVTRLTTGAITNVIDRLEKAGFVQRSRDAKDRRKVIVTYLPEKHQPVKAFYAAMAGDVYTLFTGYTETELQQLLRHTDSLGKIFEAHYHRIIAAEITSPVV